MTPEFLLTAFIVCISPGIGVVYTLSTTLGGGLRAGLLASMGCTIVTAMHLLAAMAGLAALLHTSAVLFQAIKWAGVLYLIWMAWGVLRGAEGLTLTPGEPAPAGRIVWRGIVLNLLNPKLPLFFVAFLPQFIDPRLAATPQLVELGSAFVAMTFFTFVLYAVMADAARNNIIGRPGVMAWMRRAFAASFAALGLRLAFEKT